MHRLHALHARVPDLCHPHQARQSGHRRSRLYRLRHVPEVLPATCFPFRVILLPTVFIGQFGEDITEEQIFAELHNLGFDYVIEVDKATGLLLEGTKRYMAEHPEQRPFISNFCPAIVRLIQVATWQSTLNSVPSSPISARQSSG